MAGINGIYGGFNGNDEGKVRIRKMNDAIAHRAPEKSGVYSDESIHLGQRISSTLGNLQSSVQPIQDSTGRYILVYDGEIYNYQELRKSLSDFEFVSNGDAEVLLAGLIRQGVSFLNQCFGSFSFGFWDNKKRELILARDRMGIKPLYYARTNNHFVFSSELRAILKSDLISGKLNLKTVGNFLRYQTVHDSHTILEGVFTLPAGSYLILSDHEMQIISYWDLVSTTEWPVNALSYDETKKLVKKRLQEAVERMLIADVPLGAFLSGGIDSSALVAIASKYKEGLKTFTVNFQEDDFNEARFAKLISEKYNTNHTEITLTPEALLNDLPAAIKAMDHPTGDGINTYVVSKLAKEAGISVVLSGLGGDELFAGYPIFKQFYSLKDKGWLMSFPKFTRALAGSAIKIVKPGVAGSKIKDIITEDYLDLENIYQYSREVNSIKDIKSLTAAQIEGQYAVYQLLKKGVGFGTQGFDLPILSKVTYAELLSYTEPILLRDSDQMAMAHALTLRVPFLDHRLVEAVMAVSDKFKYPHTPKQLLVESMEDMLPPEIVNRPKMGFVFPWNQWMRNELKDFCGDQLTTLAQNPVFKKNAIAGRWDKFLKNEQEITWAKIWTLCILQAWMTENEIK